MPDDRVTSDAEDMRSAIGAAISQARESAEPVEKPALVEKPTPEIKPQAEEKAPAVKPSKAPPAKSGTAAQPTTSSAQPAPDKAPDAPKADSLEAPKNWSEAHRKTFDALPSDDAKRFLLDRHREMEADYTKKTQEIADYRKRYEPVDKLFEPYQAQMKAHGWTIPALIESWSNVEKGLMDPNRRVETLMRVIETYPTDLNALAQRLAAKSGGGSATSSVSGIGGTGATSQAQPEPWRAELDQIKQRLGAEDTARLNARAMELESQINRFREAKDEKGQLLHPHFDELEGHMVQMVASLQASGAPVPELDVLYDTAAWANPSTRAKMLEAKSAADKAQAESAQQEAESRRKEEARAKAEQAKRAGKSVTGAPNSTAIPQARRSGTLSLRDELKANMAEQRESAAV